MRRYSIVGVNSAQCACRSDDLVHAKAEVLEQRICWRRSTIAMHTDHRAIQAHVLRPEIGCRGFDGDALTASTRQHRFAVSGVLTIKHVRAGHRDHAHAIAQLGGSLHRQTHFRARRDQDQFRLNDEASLNIYNTAFASRMTEVFEDDMNPTVRYTYQMWKERPLKEKLFEKFVLPFKSQL